jgi:hypothetical protein
MFKGFSVLFLFLLCFSAEARASAERLLFDSTGKKRSLQESGNSNFQELWLSYKLKSTCPDLPQKLCFAWSLKLPSSVMAGSPASLQLRDLVQSSFNFWSQPDDLEIDAQFLGFADSSEVPYLRDSAGNILLDAFQNPQVSEGFLVSFTKPTAPNFWSGAQRFQNLQFYRPHLQSQEAEVLWTGIYLNEQFLSWGNCSGQCLSSFGSSLYSVRGVLAHAIGKALGLASHANPLSLMYPIISPTRNSSLLAHSNEKQALISHYRERPQTGVIRGKLIDGQNGSALQGIEVLLLPEEKRELYAQNAEWTNISRMSWSQKDGSFEFHGLPPGDYLVMAHFPSELLQARNSFGEWVGSVTNTPYVLPNFYDGKTFESNQEIAFYSPRLSYLAATLEVVAGQETEVVELISNDHASGSLMEAVGANRERASEYDREDILSLIEAEIEEGRASLSVGGARGCQMGMNSSPSQMPIGILIGFVLLLILYRYSLGKWGRPSELFPVESQ